MCLSALFFVSCEKEINKNAYPKVETHEVEIIDNAIVGGGNVVSEGISKVTERGVCFSEHNYGNMPPSNDVLTIENCAGRTRDGSGKGTFQSILTDGLEAGHTYYVRAYAVNKHGVSYGDVISYNYVLIPAPTVNGLSVTNITQNSFYAAANAQGTVTERGICWNTTGTPTINSYTRNCGSGAGSFNATITGLSPNTRYYVRAYAKNSSGITYSSQVMVNTLSTQNSCPSTVSDYDGNSYNTVQIGTQCWMKQNLRTTHLRNGTGINYVSDSATWVTTTNNAYCYPNGVYGNKTQYGLLYNFFSVSTGLLCPAGWHVPSYNEVFTTLADYLGTNAGGQMKQTGYTYWLSPNTGATNSSDYSARGAGYRPGGYYDFKESGVYWTSTTYNGNANYAYDYMMDYNSADLYRYGSSSYDYSMWKRNGLSVRCVKDSGKGEEENAGKTSFTQPKGREVVH